MIRLSIKRTTTCFLLSLGMATAVYGQVAKVGEQTYNTLAEAFTAAANNGTVQLVSNVDISDYDVTSNRVSVSSSANITLDLNGYSLKAANTSYGNILVYGNFTLKDTKEGSTGKIYTETKYGGNATGQCLIDVYKSGSFTLESGTVEAVITENPGNYGQFAIGVWDKGKITINGGTVKAGWYTIAGNGNNPGSNTTITVNGGQLISTTDYAIYSPQDGKVVINDGATVYGYAGGIAMKRGDLVVNGGTITSKGTGSTGNWGDGTGNLNNAAINFQKRYGNVTAVVNGGTITAEGNALAVDAPSTDKGLDITIKGGTFSGETASIEPYVDEGSLATDENGKVTVKPDWYLCKVGDKKYFYLNSAIQSAQPGSTVTMLSDYSKNVAITVDKQVTIDLNGKNITLGTISANAGADLTIKDCKASGTPLVGEDNKTVTYATAGTLNMGSGWIGAFKGGKITIESGKLISNSQTPLIGAYGDETNASEVKSEVTIKGGFIHAFNSAASLSGKGAVLNIQGGVLESDDDVCVNGNGNQHGTTINVTGGTIISNVQTAGLAACGIYHPQDGTLNISGGKIVANNGVGVLVRGGNVDVTGGEVIATGDAAFTGKVGSDNNQVGVVGVLFDRDANYPAAATTAIKVEGDAKVSGTKAAVDILNANNVADADDAITVTGGTFSSDVSDFCENGSTAAPNADGTYGIVSGDIILAYKDKSQTMSASDNALEFNTADLSKFVVNAEMTGVNVKMTHNFTTTNWESFFAPFSITITDEMLQKFEFAEIFDTELGTDGVSTTLEFRKLAAGAVIEANTPFIVKALATGEATLDVANADIKKQTSTVYECSTLKQQFTFVGALERTTLKDKYGYYLSKTQQSFRPVESSEVTIAPMKFYMTIQNKSDQSYVYPSTTSEAKTFVFRVIGEETNGINDVNAQQKQGVKVYSLQGTYLGNSLRNLPAGVYIINGKKSVIK